MRIDDYELLELIARDDERETFKARDHCSSIDVVFHVIRHQADSASPRQDLTQLVRTVIANGNSRELLFAGEHDGRLYIVTEPRAECYDVRRWLEERSQSIPAAKPIGGDTVHVPSRSTAPPSKPADAGEFTRVFQTPQISTAEPSAPAGDFTRMFQLKDLHAVSPDAFAQAPPAKAPPLSRPAPTQSVQTPASEPYDFTRTFPSAAETTRGSDELQLSIPALHSGSTLTKEAEEPGEFTRVISRPPPREKPVEQAVQPAANPGLRIEGESVKPSYLPVILVLGGLFLTAVTVVLYFVFQP